MKIFYRKKDLSAVMISLGNLTIDSEFHVISGVYGGNICDYEILDIDDVETIRKINSGYEIKLISDSYGMVQIELIEPAPVEPEPSIEEYMVDLDFRVCNLELGLN